MTYTIPPGSPKAAHAAAFSREFVKALRVRAVPRSEVHRVTGIGRTTLDHYRTGSTLPRTEAAAAIAAVLNWPRLLEIVKQSRTKLCRWCGRPFLNEGGNMGVKRYCNPVCRDAAGNSSAATRRARQAAATGNGKRRYEEVARLRSGLRIVEARSGDMATAIAAFCEGCEPEGTCRTASCPLRAFSPLPLAGHRVGEPQTRLAGILERAAKRWTPEARAAQGELTRRLHLEGRVPPPPGFTDEQRAKARRTLRHRSPAQRSASARKAWETRRTKPA